MVNVKDNFVSLKKMPEKDPGSSEFQQDPIGDGTPTLTQVGPAGASKKSFYHAPVNNNGPDLKQINLSNLKKDDRSKHPHSVSNKALANAIKEILDLASKSAHQVKAFTEAERANLREALVPNESASKAEIVAARKRLAEFASIYNRLHTTKMKLNDIRKCTNSC